MICGYNSDQPPLIDMHAIAKFFKFDQRQTTLAREVRGGFTTYLTMLYIVLVNPLILAGAGISPVAAATATALAAGVCCILMGLIANFPMALAAGMGLNAFVAFKLTGATQSWETAMGLVVIEGLLVLVLVLAGIREAVLRAIPVDLRIAIGVGIGLFIAVIGLKNAGFIKADPITMVAAGALTSSSAMIAAVGLILTAGLMIRRVSGAILIGIIGCTILALVFKITKLPNSFPSPDFSTLFKANIAGALKWEYVPMILALMMVDFFDTLGTATAVAEEGKLMDAKGNIPGVRRVLIVDSVAASIGGLFGSSSNTSYIESASGVAEGARTGLHSVVVGILFLATIFLAPLAGIVPDFATAPALILVGFLMMSHIADIKFDNYAKAIPAFLTILGIPLTFSIAHGIGFGFVSYVLLHLVSGKIREVHPLMWVLAAAFIAYFATGN